MRRAITLWSFVVAVVALSPAPSGLAADDFTFNGSGLGHGVGMGQWGAYGLAQDGWGHQRILTHFFTGTKVRSRPALAPDDLRIGLTQGKSKIRLAAEAGKVTLVLGGPKASDPLGTIPSGEIWTIRSTGSHYRVLDAQGHRVANGVGGPNNDLFATYADAGSRVKVPEAGHTYNRGYLEFNLYSCSGGCALRLIAVLEPEKYLYGIGEVPSEWPMETLQTQAVAARTYAFFKAQYGQHRNPCNCALYGTSLDQVYAGWDKEGGPSGDRWVRAVNQTSSQVVISQGDLINAQYTASTGGYSENNENVWGGSPLPYLRGVCDPGDFVPANSSRVWSVQMSAQDVSQDLSLGIGTVTGFTEITRGVSGRIISATVEGTDGTATVSGIALRLNLGLRDDRVWINANRNVTGSIRIKYDALGCAPGLATSHQVAVAGGQRQKFENGTIYVKEGVGAHYLTGRVLDFYVSLGGPKGDLGFPTTDVKTKDGGTKTAGFEHGTITCPPSGTCARS